MRILYALALLALATTGCQYILGLERGVLIAIDKGNSELADLPEVDLDGKPRIVDGDGDDDAIIDIGAYERHP